MRAFSLLFLLFILFSCAAEDNINESVVPLPEELPSEEKGEYDDMMSSIPNVEKDQISFMHISDTHGSDLSIRPMIYALNNCECDFAIITGDILPSTETIEYMASSKKPVLLVIGNHDAYDKYGQTGFRKNVMDKVSNPSIVYPNDSACYYHIDFYKNGHSLRVIALDQYEIDTEGKSSAHNSVISQKQVNWLIDLLDKSEQFDGIVLLMHQGFGNAGVGVRDTTNMNDFISLYAKDYTKGYYHIGKYNPKLIPRILNAYISGKNINGDKYSTGFDKRELEVKTNFSGPHYNFVGYFGGHIHMDLIEYLPYMKNQLQILMAYSGKGTGSIFNDLLKSTSGPDSYNFNYSIFDFKMRKLKIHRIGANVKVDGTTRDSISFDIRY